MTQAAQRISGEAAPALPAHIAIIMDGNGRWAQQRGVPRARGHQQGGESLRALLEACRTRPYIRYLTLYAFSIENWDRPAEEVSDLMNLLRHYIKREASVMHANNIRMRFIGELDALAADIQEDLESVRRLTADNTGLTVNIAVSYGARQEIATAMQRLAQEIACGALQASDITPERIAQQLHTAGMPDPDLLIRTGGDHRISNFLLWQSAYTEFYFCETLWPDFNADDLDAAIADFGRRERRFGKRNPA
jgi:undecaprenyl diphosphate synthase